MKTHVKYKPKDRPMLHLIIAVLKNPWFWYKLWQNFLKKFFPSMFNVAKLYHPALDAKLVSLDGKELSLLEDFVNKMPPHMPLVIHMGSYN
jgi:hypothetical protein